MATAFEKFVAKMNEMSEYWEKEITVVGHAGRPVVIRYRGWTFKDDALEKAAQMVKANGDLTFSPLLATKPNLANNSLLSKGRKLISG